MEKVYKYHDIVKYIIQKLEVFSICKLRCVNKFFKNFIDDNKLANYENVLGIFFKDPKSKFKLEKMKYSDIRKLVNISWRFTINAESRINSTIDRMVKRVIYSKEVSEFEKSREDLSFALRLKEERMTFGKRKINPEEKGFFHEYETMPSKRMKISVYCKTCRQEFIRIISVTETFIICVLCHDKIKLK